MTQRPSDPDLPTIPSSSSTSDRLVETLERGGFFPGPISPERHAAIQAIVQEFLDEAARERVEWEVATRPRTASRATLIFTSMMVLLCAFVWIVQPTAPRGLAYQTPHAFQDASLRLAMVLERSKVEQYAEVYGQLPARLETDSTITYRKLSATAYEIHGVNGAIQLVLPSTESSAQFLGASLDLLSRWRASRGGP